MGQRHQIYVVRKRTEKETGKDTYQTILAYHHQWLYGATASFKAIRACEVLSKVTGGYLEARDLDSIFKAVYGIDENRDGSLSTRIIHNESEYLIDEKSNKALITQGDNNDGITIICFEDKKKPFEDSNLEVSYCFASFCGVEGEHSDKIKNFTPYTAKQYLSFYYDEKTQAEILESIDDPQNDIGPKVEHVLNHSDDFKMITKTVFNKIIKK